MNLVIDIGNTRAKLCVYQAETLVEKLSVESRPADIQQAISALLDSHSIRACIYSSVGADVYGLVSGLMPRGTALLRFGSDTPVPIANSYGTPGTLGVDRLAAAVGASVLFPGADALVIDAGTAITYDYLRGGCEFVGGNIAPGIRLRIKSLNSYTSRLPLVEPGNVVNDFGKSTAEAISNGVVMGVMSEIAGYVELLKQKNVKPVIILTGGDSIFLYRKLKITIFAEPNLVTIGLNRILNYNVLNKPN